MPGPEAERQAAIFIDGGYLDKTLRYSQELWTAADDRFPLDEAFVSRIRR